MRVFPEGFWLLSRRAKGNDSVLCMELATSIRAIVLRVKQAGGWRLEEYGWLPRIILKTSSSLRVFASVRDLWLFESPRKADFQPASAEDPRPVRKNRVRVVKRMLLVIENGSTSAQLLVQSTILGRAPSKII